MAEELSGVTVVIFIACGILTFILLFIFAKRQIMRFALRSRRGPHIPIGHGAKSAVKREIEHYIEVIPRIVFEPPVMMENSSDLLSHNLHLQPSHYCRLKAIVNAKHLEMEIAKTDINLQRCSNENLRGFLLMALMPPMNGADQKIIHQFCDLYEHARHDPTEFGEEEYQLYLKLFLKLMELAKLIKSHPNSKKNSPSKSNAMKVANDDGIRGFDKRTEASVLMGIENKEMPRVSVFDDNETTV